MSRSVSLDPSRRLDLNFRCNRNGDIAFTVLDSAGAAFSLVYEDFQFIVKSYPGDRTNQINLTVGSGITLSGNQILIEVTATQANLAAAQYYWELLQVDDNETWLSGNATFHQGPFDAANDDISIELTEREVVNLYITL